MGVKEALNCFSWH